MRIFVHKYKYSHEVRRRAFFKALKRGSITIVNTFKDGWLYINNEVKNVQRR